MDCQVITLFHLLYIKNVVSISFIDDTDKTPFPQLTGRSNNTLLSTCHRDISGDDGIVVCTRGGGSWWRCASRSCLSGNVCVATNQKHSASSSCPSLPKPANTTAAVRCPFPCQVLKQCQDAVSGQASAPCVVTTIHRPLKYKVNLLMLSLVNSKKSTTLVKDPH